MILQEVLKRKSYLKGFTLVELLISLAIGMILVAVVTPLYGNLQVSTQLSTNSSQISQNIRLAKEKSIASLNDSAHGIKFFSDHYVLYQGSSYDLRSISNDLNYSIPSSIITTSSLTNNEINFSKGLGVPNNIGTITLTHSTDGIKHIIINELGIVTEQ